MAKQKKTLKIDALELTIHELTMRQIRDLFAAEKATEKNAETQTAETPMGMDKLDKFLELSCPGLTLEIALDLSPSEIKQIWDVFREVNADFLGIVEKTGVKEKLLGMALSELQAALATSTSKSAD